jgi:hypothetical protein
MTVSISLARARSACQGWLLVQDAPEAVILLHELGKARSDVGARRWIRRILDDQEPRGGWGGDLLRTAESLHAISELRSFARLAEQDPGIGLALDWIRSRRGLPGSWADGCTPDRHVLGLCHHFVGGLFSASPPDQEFDETRLRSGALVVGDMEIRLVASAAALRCLLDHGEPGRDDRLHLDALRRLIQTWGRRGSTGLGTTALLAAIHALVGSGEEADAEAVQRGLHLVGGRQRGDGSWVDTDAFHALEVIGAVADAGITPEPTRRALWHGARLLIASQQADGSWGADHGARRALIAWRTFRRVEQAPGS